ncbi:MAG: 6-carboxyhexanoate--CoA ligase, partial [Desulfovibrio sp.]|nr:6-carboxyhexanoate--CoA ligase [Desulfovibrio sp.]
MFCSIKMRASRSIAGQDYHISGAERLLESKDIPACACGLLLRALQHSKGEPSAINLKVEEIDPSCVKQIAPLKVSTLKAKSVEEARELALSYLVRLGIKEKGLFSLLSQCFGLRGAMLVDFKTMERLDLLLGRDEARGIRVTYMDWQGGGGEWQKKNNFAEALVLASKVAAAPGLVAELCVSDDPDYLTGYVASKEFGYVRIAPLKKMGEDFGGRIFFLDQSQASLEECVHFLEKEIVLVKRPETETKDPKLWLGARLANLRKAKLFRQCNLVTSAQNRSITTCQKSSLNFASNDYLALANHPLVKAKAQEALGRYGAGSGGSRLTCGTLPVHVELEQALARHFGSEDALVFATGYQTNVGTLQALCGRGDVVISDALNHASIIDGCRLSGAEVVVYAHNDMADFERCCKAYAHRRGLCVSDSVFSMDG